jgi:hypothetical protein
VAGGHQGVDLAAHSGIEWHVALPDDRDSCHRYLGC